MHKVTSLLLQILFKGGRLLNNGKDEGLSILKFSMDYDMIKEEGDNNMNVDWDDISLGKRYEVPSELLDRIEHVIPTVLKGGRDSWTTTDSTFVKYHEGDLQVPNIDPCDATLLICLQPCMEGFFFILLPSA